MTTRIHLTTEPEPPVIHGKEDGLVFAVQLAIEVQNVEETEAKREFSDLLAMFPKAKLVLITPSYGAIEVDRAFKVPLDDGEAAPDVPGWLEAYRDGAIKLAEQSNAKKPLDMFYVSDARDASGMLNARAVDLLRSTWRWPAPLAQKAGLVTAAHVPDGAGGGDEAWLALVPEDTDVATVQIKSANSIGQPLLYDVVIEWTDPTPGELHFRTEILNGRILDLPDRFEENGRFVLPANPEAEQRLLQRVEERAASALWIAPLLGTLAQDPRYDVHFQVESESHPYSGEAFHWLAQASVMTLFDIVIGGLLLPVSNKEAEVSRRSSVLERLTRLLAGKAELKDLSKDVDEDELYLALHTALWAHLKGKTPADVWADSRGALQDEEEAKLIEAALVGDPPADIEAKDWPDLLTKLSGALGTLADLLESESESESSAEDWLIKQFDDAIEPATHSLLYGAVSELTGDEIMKEYNAFLNDMRANFDASAVLRNEFGAEAVAALAGQIAREDTMGKPVDVPALLRTLVKESKPLVERFEPNTGTGVFDRLWAASPKVVATHPNDDLLEDGMDDPLATLSRDPDTRPDFRPDDKPMPILIPIADNPDIFNRDGSVEHMSGLGFLAQVYLASDPDEGAYAPPVHLNLIGFDDDLFFTDYANSVDPMLPLPAPGAAALTIPFSGVPLSSPNLTEPGVGGQDGASQSMQTILKDMRAYAKIEASYADAGDRIPTPAYGTAIRPSAFWVPPSGVLPPELRDGGDPFTPKRPATGSIFWHDDTPWLSRRRTAISGADISVKSAPGALPSLPKDVNPIALDDPRITVESLEGAERHRDIFRAVGGVGTLEPAAVTIVLKEVSVSGNEALSDLKVGVISDTESGPDVLAADQLSYDPDKRTLTIEVPERVSSSWLRLWFDIGLAKQSFSFADPKAEQGQDGSTNATSPLLLAPKGPDTWGDWPSQQTLRIDGPRVSFEDLERWAANSGLWARTCGAGTDPAGVLAALRFARAVFEETGHTYAERLKSMPDPAVKRLKVGLAQADFTTAAPDSIHGAESYDFDISPYFWADADLPDSDAAPSELIGNYEAFIDRVFNEAGINLPVSEGTLSLSKTGAKVPRGTVAHLRVSPVLPAEFFKDATDNKPLTGIFLPRITELSVGRVFDMSADVIGLLFDGPSLAIEVMDEVPKLLEPLSQDILTIDASGRNRGYLVSAALPRFLEPVGLDKVGLRWVGDCDLVTQRWRFTGTPIYQWIDAARGGESGPVVAVGENTSVVPRDREGRQTWAQLTSFEADAFALRRNDDADFKRYRLRPADERTVLGQFDWPEKSATYYRHRIELISRYAGAMRDAQFARYAVKHSVSEGGTDPWTARVAILCEPQAISVVRPQFRTCLPVQKRVSAKKREPANAEIEPTPIACVLSEPPFAQLGLADRLDVDIATKPLFEVDPQLEMTGLRKEISPDPLLSYFRVNDDVSNSAAVHVEGPAGLHFDATNSTDPAWSNSQFMLHLSIPAAERPSASATELEESFAGVILSRHADPAWSWSDSSASSASERIEDVWIETAQSQVRIVDDDDQNFVTVERPINAKPIVRIRSSAIWTEASVEMVTLWEGFVDALLLKPLGANRYRLSVFRLAVDRSVTDDGHINRPQLVSSIVFQGPAVKGLKVLGAESLRATRQSEATLIEWARSGRDLTRLSIRRDGSEHSISSTSLLASIDNGRLTFSDPSGQSAAIASPVAHRRYPLHLHRRLVAVLQKPSKQVGHKIDLFDRALLLDHLGRAQAGTNSGATSAVLAEMECRAEVVFLNADVRATLGAELDAALTDNADYVRYRSAAFPFFATSESPGAIRQFRFHIRGASGPLHLSTLSLGIKAKRDPDQEEVEEVFGPDLSTIGGHALALDVVLYAESAETVIRVSGGRPNGTSFDVSPFELRFSDNTAVPFNNVRSLDRLEMVLSDSSTTPRWADVSLIHSNSKFEPTDPDKFDLDWLFGPNDGASVSLPADLAPERLNKLAEAQARLIGLSDSIPLEDRTDSLAT